MRGNDAAFTLCGCLREQIQGVGIPDGRQFELANHSIELPCPFRRAEAGPECDGRRPFEQRRQGIRVADTVAHKLGTRAGDDRCMRRVRGNANQARARAERRLAGQPDCTRHAFAAADDQDMAEIALVGAP